MNVVENSRRYRALPLVSPAFVSQFPMFSQLLHQFGISLETAVSPERDFLVDIEETSYNVFYVPTASGSPHVPVQADFVAKYGVQSVLCFGGLLSSKDLFAVILFSRIPIDRESANLCKSLALGVKLSLLPFVDDALPSAEAANAGRSARSEPVSRDSSHSALIEVSGQLLDFYEDAVRAQAEGISNARQEVRDRAAALERAEQGMREQTQIVKLDLAQYG